MKTTNTRALLALALASSLSVVCLMPQPAFAVGGSGCVVTSCSAPAPTCAQRTTYGTDNCGNTCDLKFNNTCNAPAAYCNSGTPVNPTGIRICGEPCQNFYNNTCNAPSPACGQTTTGTYTCGGAACTRIGASCNTNVPYGFILPGDPVYGFPNITSGGKPIYKDPNTQDLVGFAAKGNVIIGDYTSQAFKDQVLPNLKPKTAQNPSGKTQSHAVDTTDEALGYWTGNGGIMYDAKGRPLFSGNYDQQDKQGGLPGTKTDGSARKFYESSLPDASFQALVNMPPGDDVTIDGVIFTNHAFAGYAPGDVEINGSTVARDDALVFSGNDLAIIHDMRLISAQGAQQVALPQSLVRPKLMTWKECPPSGC